MVRIGIKVPAYVVKINQPELFIKREFKMESNQALRKNPSLHDIFSEDEECAGGELVALRSAVPVNGGVDLKSIREAIARIEAETKITVAAENRSLAETRARSLADDRIRADSAAAAEVYRSAKAAEESVAASRARLDAERKARAANEVRPAAANKEIAELRARIGADTQAGLLAIECAKAEQQVLEAMQQTSRAEEDICRKAELHASAERKAAMLAAARLAAEAKARVAAEKHAIEATRMLAGTEAQSADVADSAYARHEREEADARVLTQRLIERISQQGEQLSDWRVRAEAVLAESPTPLFLKKPKSRMQSAMPILAGLALTVGVVGAMIWNGIAEMDGTVKSAAQQMGMSPALNSAAMPLLATHMPATLHGVKLQMSYEIKCPATSSAAGCSTRTGKHQ